jgi:cation-transporting P-type ATPase E
MLPRAVTEGRRIARNIHRLGRLYLTKSVYAGFLILLAAIFDFAFPFLPRQLTVAAMLTIGIPSFVLALAPSEGPLYRGRLLRALAAFAFPAGIAMGIASLFSFFFVDTVFGGTLDEGRTAATTTLIVLGLCFIVLLERGPGREHITIQSYMLALVAGLGALFALILAAAPVRDFFDLTLLSGGQWFLALAWVAIGLGLAGAAWQLPYVQRLELPEGAEADDGGPAPTHRPRTGEFGAVGDPGAPATQAPPADGAPPPEPGSAAPGSAEDAYDEEPATRVLDEPPTRRLPGS